MTNNETRPTLPPAPQDLADVARYEQECLGTSWPLVTAILKGLVPAIPEQKATV